MNKSIEQMAALPTLTKTLVKKQLRALSKDRTDEVTTGILSEGRIFFLGKFDVDIKLFELSHSVMDNLKENVNQPFGIHPWYFSMDVRWPDHTEYTTVLVRVDPNPRDQNEVSSLFFHAKSDLSISATEGWMFNHGSSGFLCRKLTETGFDFTGEFAPTCYMIAIACLNTRGCSIERSKSNKLMRSSINQKVPHYNVDASEYITAIRSSSKSSVAKKGENSQRRRPIPHLRRGHERILNDKRIWIRDMLINVRSESDVAFVDKRIAYVVK